MRFYYNRVLMTALISLSVWIVAMVTNALLFAIIFACTSDRLEGLGFVIVFSAVCSVPGIVAFWLIFLYHSRNLKLFYILIAAAGIITLLSGLIIFMWICFGSGIDSLGLLLLIPVVVAVISVIVHGPAINDVVTAHSDPFHKNTTLET